MLSLIQHFNLPTGPLKQGNNKTDMTGITTVKTHHSARFNQKLSELHLFILINANEE